MPFDRGDPESVTFTQLRCSLLTFSPRLSLRVAIGYGQGDNLELLGSGTGGVDGAREHFKDEDVVYAYIRVTTGDEESKRAKFVLFTWVGPDVKILRKAKVSVHKADVKSVFSAFAVEWQASDEDGLDAEKLKETVVKAGGANYMGQSS